VTLLFRNAAAVAALASLAALATALGSQFLGGLPPCELCHWQRVPYAAVVVVAGAAVLRRPAFSRAAVALSALLFLAGAALALYHVGVEQGWFQPPGACSANFGAAQSVEELKRLLEAAPITRCTDVAWSLFGLSIAGYNFIASAVLTVFSAIAAVRMGSLVAR
jgi:disulfide bond formation protein DsbB